MLEQSCLPRLKAELGPTKLSGRIRPAGIVPNHQQSQGLIIHFGTAENQSLGIGEIKHRQGFGWHTHETPAAYHGVHGLDSPIGIAA